MAEPPCKPIYLEGALSLLARDDWSCKVTVEIESVVSFQHKWYVEES